MSVSAPRYAIYFVPPAASALYRFGTSVLGYDCYTGDAVVPLPGASCASGRSWSEVVGEPRKYGFHATLKPPFRLLHRTALLELTDALERFAATPRPVPTVELRVGLLGSFVALTPLLPDAALDRLAAECVIEFDRFRAPPTDEERARRLAQPLDAQQRINLDRWGYPYVFESFRFHMTLTGPLPHEERESVRAALDAAYRRAGVRQPVPIRSVSLLAQEPASAFKVIGQWRLRNHSGPGASGQGGVNAP